MTNIKKFLRRMIRNKGFIAKGIYSENYKYWHHNTRSSMTNIDLVLFSQLKSCGYIKMDRTGKYYPTEKGIKFALPWYKKLFF